MKKIKLNACEVDQLNVQNPNKIVRISDDFEIPTILQPNDFGLSEIGTRSDFGIPL